MKFKVLNFGKKTSGKVDDRKTWRRAKESAAVALGALALAGAVFGSCGGRTELRTGDLVGGTGGETGVGGEVATGGEAGVGGVGGQGGSGGETPVLGMPYNLIGDYLNRELLDREGNSDPSDADQAYEIGGPDNSVNANPFTNGAGSNLGVSEEFIYRIGQMQYPMLADLTVMDADAGDTYTEMQSVWVQGDNHFYEYPDDVIGKLRFIAYSLKFDGPGGGQTGIPVCTDADNNDYTYCKTSALGDIYDATETHKVQVYFLGEQWVLLDMNAPSGTLDNESELVNGGSVTLAKESVGGIMDEGEYLAINDLKFRLDSIEASGNTVNAIFSVLDANDTVLQTDAIGPNETREFNILGDTYKLHVYVIAAGTSPGSRWADIAMLSSTLKFEDGKSLDSDNGTNPGWDVTLGWKNRGASVGSTKPDSLRTIIVWSDDVENVSSSGDNVLETGDYVSLVTEPELWRFSYKGLDITSADRSNVKFELQTTSDKNISETSGPIINGSQSSCTIFAPYIEVDSSEGGAVFSVEREDDITGAISDNEFIVALARGATCSNAQGQTYLPPGTVFMMVSPSSSDYSFGSGNVMHELAGGEVEIIVESTGDMTNPWPSIGALLRSAGSDCGVGTDCSDPQGFKAGVPDVLISITEKAGVDSSGEYKGRYIFGVDKSGTASPSEATFDFDFSDNGSFQITSDDEMVLYGHACPGDYSNPSGPVESGMPMVEEGYISERGSVFQRIDDSTVEFVIAHKVAKAVWELHPQ